ncbi:uncharacterized protein LOC117904717 [Vitis riparia]|uniref:uncharacterized protein LOC117904717 n=1 Tax=Vitis riparia TaxID=96939 RepID=UPI00155A08C9|nr:uncharacterized protein LOC117904717 [Vitis riparia]
MSAFWAKLAAAIAAVFLLVSGFPASYASHPHAAGCDTSPWWVGGTRKIVAGRTGNSGCEGQISIYNKKVVPLRSLRSGTPSQPPAPTVNRSKSYRTKAPPPQIS